MTTAQKATHAATNMQSPFKRKLQSVPYAGETNHLVRNGHGVYKYDNKFYEYAGQWENGKKHGHGKLSLKDGSYYEGAFEKGEIQGRGYKYFAGSNCHYKGDFWRGEMHGSGVMTYNDGTVYEGTWYRNKRQGYGILRYGYGDTYQGEFKAHHRDGYGKIVFRNGDVYRGNWVGDKREGMGQLAFQDGSVYEGEWHDDTMEGQGRMQHRSGMVYDGQWKDGKPVRLATKLVFVLEFDEVPSDGCPDGSFSRASSSFEFPLGTESQVVFYDLLEIERGRHFYIWVETRNDQDELIEEDNRLVELSAGFRRYPLSTKSASKPSLFELLEEELITTPYGYDVVRYPLTDTLPESNPEKDTTPSVSRVASCVWETELTLDTLQECAEPEPAKPAAPQGTVKGSSRQPPSLQQSEGKGKRKGKTRQPPSLQQSEGTMKGSSRQPPSLQQSEASKAPEFSQADGGLEDEARRFLLWVTRDPDLVALPVAPKRTRGGLVAFRGLQLAPPPSDYRPFLQLDQELAADREEVMKERARIREERKVQALKKQRSGNYNSDPNRNNSKKPPKKKKAPGSPSKSKSKTGTGSRSKSGAVSTVNTIMDEPPPPVKDMIEEAWLKRLQDDFDEKKREYVLMAHDITHPPFVGGALRPAFLVLRYKAPPRSPDTDSIYTHHSATSAVNFRGPLTLAVPSTSSLPPPSGRASSTLPEPSPSNVSLPVPSAFSIAVHDTSLPVPTISLKVPTAKSLPALSGSSSAAQSEASVASRSSRSGRAGKRK